MKSQAIWRLLWLGLAAALVACGGGEISVSTARISDARLAKDQAGSQATTTFAPGDTFYLLVDLANAPDDTRVKASWTAVDVEGVAPNTVLDDVELTSSDATLTFDLANDNPWPAGEYQVELFLNGESERTIAFRVAPQLGAAEPTAEPVAAPTEAAAPEPTAEMATGAVTDLGDVKSAIVQIEAQGTFVDPEVGMLFNAAGRGSGFIIDPSGIAVTNNHVVTGAALLRVWVGGESEPRNARVLGASECADLAVIDIDGDGYPYLEWYDGAVDVGLDVYAAGFPLGDPEYTLTRGIISKARTSGETSWASVDDVVEHDATINPGNSGGPLVAGNGQVVGINYASASSVNQYFAIAQPQALPVIDRLRQGQDYLSIGVNGEAVNDGESLSGIWVSSVKSGSPADEAGVKGGDIITSLENLVLATDGTLSDYCDILRSHAADDTLAIEVLRFDTQEVLEGQLNGRELVQSFSFAQELSEEAADTPSGAGGGTTTYDEYVTVTDDSGLLVMEVPAAWSDINGSAWVSDDQEIGLALSASPNLDDFWSTWTMPGAFFAASDQLDLTVDGLLDSFDYSNSCTFDSRNEYSDPLYTGRYDLWIDCGGTDSIYIVLASEPEDQSFLIMVTVQIVSDEDLDALDHILDTFVVSQ